MCIPVLKHPVPFTYWTTARWGSRTPTVSASTLSTPTRRSRLPSPMPTWIATYAKTPALPTTAPTAPRSACATSGRATTT